MSCDVGVSKLCWMGRKASFLVFERHGSRRKAWNDAGNLFETSAVWEDMI